MTKPRYIHPLRAVDVDTLRTQAARRRKALANAGCSTYAIGERGGQAAIMCLCCGLGSNHPDDIANRYCGFCHEFHSEWREAEKP